MSIFRATLKGSSALLINAFALDFGMEEKVAKRKKNDDYGSPREQAEKVLYSDKKTGKLWVPSSWVKGTMMGAASEYKLPSSRKSLKSILGGAVIPVDEKCYFVEKFTKKNIEIDSRPVVIQRAKIMRHRPRLEKWSITCELEIDESLVPAKTILELLNDCGRRVGVGDFRPQKGGPFGRFQISSWKKVK